MKRLYIRPLYVENKVLIAKARAGYVLCFDPNDKFIVLLDVGNKYPSKFKYVGADSSAANDVIKNLENANRKLLPIGKEIEHVFEIK